MTKYFYKCKKCPAKFETYEEFAEHIQRSHSSSLIKAFTLDFKW